MNNNLELFTSPRQFPVDANIIHTFGQLMATTGPLFIIQSLGILSVLIGVLLVALVDFSIAPNRSSLALTFIVSKVAARWQKSLIILIFNNFWLFGLYKTCASAKIRSDSKQII